MKDFQFFSKSLVFVLFLVALTFAQTKKPQTSAPTKIASINTEAFYDKETGIKEVVETNARLETEFKPQKDELNLINEKIKKLEKELKDTAGMIESPRDLTIETTDGRVNEYDLAVENYKNRQAEIKVLYEKRKAEIFADVYKKVREAIKQFAKEKGFMMIIDSSKSNRDPILGDFDDVTEELIKYYNSNFAKTKSE